MAVTGLELQEAHGYVVLIVVLTMFVNIWAGEKVGAARKTYNIPYPQMYAEKSDRDAIAFNCIQRAHQNLLEQIPIFFAALFLGSFYHPVIAAIAGFVRVLGFIAYVRGYATGVPNKRLQGVFGHLAMLVLLGLTIETGLRFLGVF